MKYTSNDTPVIHMWDCPMPRSAEPAAGFPVVEHAEHSLLYYATRETGAYSHHPKITWYNGQFHAIWSNHPHGEDGPGQRVLYSSSPDAVTWNDWVEIFAPPGPIRPGDDRGLALTACSWLETDDGLFAVACCNDNIGFTDFKITLQPGPVRDKEHPRRARKGYASLARQVNNDDDCKFGQVFALWDNMPDNIAFDCLRYDDPCIRDIVCRLNVSLRDPQKIPNWDFSRSRYGFPRAVEGHPLCEPTVYRAAAGKYVMLLRDCLYSHRLYRSVIEQIGEFWPAAEPTDIPDSPSLSASVTLEDGGVFLIGNQTSPEFDNPNRGHYARDPLVVTFSPDGCIFNQVHALRAGAPPNRIDGVRGRGAGYQYPDAIVRGDMLYVIYSIGKEDIAVTCVPVEACR